jgi:hypothetical protein
LGISPGVGLLDHMADLYLDFQEACKFFSRAVTIVCIPTSSVR